MRAWRSNKIWVFAEAVLITAAVLGICYLAKPQNPLFIRGIFPWPWLAPILIVLRYGLSTGLLSAALVCAAAILLGPAKAVLLPDYQYYLISCFGVTFFCGLLNSNAVNRYTKAEELLAYAQDKLQNLSRSYYLLHISHNTLEKNLISQANTPRGMIEKLKKILIHQEGILTADLAYQFLQLICQQCFASVIGIYRGSQAAELELLTEMGNMGKINPNDPVLLKALKTKEPAYIRSDLPENTYLVAIPMQNSDGKIQAVLIIKEMPFNDLTTDNLRLLNILVTYLMESFYFSKEAAQFLNQFPDCPPAFLQELSQLLQLKTKMNVDSALVALIIDKNLRPYNVVDNLMQRQRTLDACWLRTTEPADILITLMPFTNAAGINGYLERIKRYLSSHTSLNIDQQKIKTRSIQLLTVAAGEMMETFMTNIKEAV